MLKKPASFVLASLRGSTYRRVRLASSLAAALLDSLFEHPRKREQVVCRLKVVAHTKGYMKHVVRAVESKQVEDARRGF